MAWTWTGGDRYILVYTTLSTLIHICKQPYRQKGVYMYSISDDSYNQGIQSADSSHVINILTSGLFTVNVM